MLIFILVCSDRKMQHSAVPKSQIQLMTVMTVMLNETFWMRMNNVLFRYRNDQETGFTVQIQRQQSTSAMD